MSQLKCPHCGQSFVIDDTESASIMMQIRDVEFQKDVEKRVAEIKDQLSETYQAKLKTDVAEAILQTKTEADVKISDLQSEVQRQQESIVMLNAQVKNSEITQELAVLQAVSDIKQEMSEQKSNYERKIREKQEQVDYYKDLKSRMSTKMVGETLEQHCLIEFNKLRATAFRNVYFEKDNDARSGSKGDFIYRETDENGVEIISIMFEMKNEMDSTEKKHKNQDFFKELDKDRNEKNCEYAVLVTLLESDNELYNTGIVDVSYQYDKMYVIRPQFFIPMITILRNAALNAMQYKKELAFMQSQNIDVTDFEEKLQDFKSAFARNYDLASRKFGDAIAEIDKTIDHLQKTKAALLSSENQLRLANNKAEDLTIRKLAKNNATMLNMFESFNSEKK